MRLYTKFMIKEIQKKNDSKTLIKFPVLEGDSQIYLGQTIVTLVRMGIKNNNTYSDEIQHRFKVELMASVLSELDVTLDDRHCPKFCVNGNRIQL